jgi:protein-glutamine gamma-glutamyltransferase
MRALEAIRRANQPGPPEDSVRLRVACAGAVLASMAAAASLGEVSWSLAAGAMALVALGMAFSYATRVQPPGAVKVLVAAVAIAAFAWFFTQVTGPTADITTVDHPLTLLLVAILVVHSFHVPARRDLLFSLGASAGLMAVGATQAIDVGFGLYVLAWAAFGLWGLVEMWSSVSGGGRLGAVGLGSALAAMTALAAAIFLVLPAPTVAARISFLSKAGFGGSVSVPGALAGDGGGPVQLARSGTRNGATRVGGYLGFASSLDTALRGKLGNTVVMQVRAQRPSYWVGETYDRWDGQSWTASAGITQALRESSPFVLPVPEGDTATGQGDLQTFYVTTSTPDLVFHAESAQELWFPTSTVFYSADGTIVSPIGLGKGAIYTVESEVTAPSPAQLSSDSTVESLRPATERQYLQLPHPYPRVKALATEITAGDTNNYDRVESLIAWIGAHTHYSTDIPPLSAGADTVDEFLFGNRIGYCEQISTSLAVMLRSLGIPAREAVGYVPGSYNPITDLYQVRADDAHAWVQVWFPGYGWQNFDPTAVVPAANPAPGAAALTDLGHVLRHVPLLPVGIAVLSVAVIAAALRWLRSRPSTWAERVTRSIERAGRWSGHPRLPHETLSEYATALDIFSGDRSGTCHRLSLAVEASSYGGHEPPPEVQRQLIVLARRIRNGRRQGVFRRAPSRRLVSAGTEAAPQVL